MSIYMKLLEKQLREAIEVALSTGVEDFKSDFYTFENKVYCLDTDAVISNDTELVRLVNAYLATKGYVICIDNNTMASVKNKKEFLGVYGALSQLDKFSATPEVLKKICLTIFNLPKDDIEELFTKAYKATWESTWLNTLIEFDNVVSVFRKSMM